MKNIFGNNITITLFGESHGEAIGCVLDGVAPGIAIDTKYIESEMLKRKARSDISTPRQEGDSVELLSGVKNGYTEGTPILILIRNENKKSSAYSSIEDTPRPSHADYSAECKYHGFQDKAGGGHFSGRITAPIVAAGAILRRALEKKGIKIGTHIKKLHGISDIGFINLDEDIDKLNSAEFPTLDEEVGRKMIAEIKEAKSRLDSVGGVLETVIIGMPVGVGEPWFDTVESMLSHAMLSIPAVKGIEFGLGFGFADFFGSEVKDEFAYGHDGNIITKTNNNAGINGGITNGMPISFSLVIKPTPSISSAMHTVNLRTGEECEITVGGRHDPAIIHRARAVVDAMTAIVIADLLATRYGTDYLK